MAGKASDATESMLNTPVCSTSTMTFEVKKFIPKPSGVPKATVPSKHQKTSMPQPPPTSGSGHKRKRMEMPDDSMPLLNFDEVERGPTSKRKRMETIPEETPEECAEDC